MALAAYLLLWPVPIDPVAFNLPQAPGYQGVHAVNTQLANLKMIDLHGEEGPEHIAIGPDGKLYAAVASGNILRMDPDGANQAVFANTGGRVLGFDFDAQGNLIAADAIKGLLSVSPDGKTTTVLADKVGNDPIRYADAVVVAKSGKMYFSDASMRFAPKDWGGTFNASVIAFTEDGKIVADLQDPSGAYPETTAITETQDRLYVQSLHAHGLGWLPHP
ncbi:MAG: hypothetical protein U1E84_10270 [Rhodoferax sp.]